MIGCAELLFVTEILFTVHTYDHLPILHLNVKKELMQLAIDSFKLPYEITEIQGPMIEIRKKITH